MRRGNGNATTWNAPSAEKDVRGKGKERKKVGMTPCYADSKREGRRTSHLFSIVPASGKAGHVGKKCAGKLQPNWV